MKVKNLLDVVWDSQWVGIATEGTLCQCYVFGKDWQDKDPATIAKVEPFLERKVSAVQVVEIEHPEPFALGEKVQAIMIALKA